MSKLKRIQAIHNITEGKDGIDTETDNNEGER